MARSSEVHLIYIKNIRNKFSWHIIEHNHSYWYIIGECVWQILCNGNRVSYTRMLDWNYSMYLSCFLSLIQFWLYHLPFIVFFVFLSLITAGFFRENLNSKLARIYHHHYHHYHCIIIIVIVSSSSSRNRSYSILRFSAFFSIVQLVLILTELPSYAYFSVLILW